MQGGIWQDRRRLLTSDEDPLYGRFEQDVNGLLGSRIRRSEQDASEFWSALANVSWFNSEGQELFYTFRAAGDLIAAIRWEGDYMDWYCSGAYAVVADWISSALAERGWTYKV